MLEKNRKIRFLDLAAVHAELRDEIEAAILDVSRSGTYLLGSKLATFEDEFANYTGAKYCAGVSNGLDALKLALLSVGVSPGDEVIVPAHTFIATWLAVSQVGAVPVPIEPEWDTMNIDPSNLQASITSKTKAILVTHLYGMPANLRPLIGIARQNGIPIIEDAAQAQGASYFNKKIGGHSDLVCWSFYPGKNLGAMGDAGGITTNSAEYDEKIRALRNYGALKKYVHTIIGFNCRMDEVQAAILSVKLRKLDEWNLRRHYLADVYKRHLSNLPIVLPYQEDNYLSSWHLYVIRTPLRNKLYEHLISNGCDVLIHYPIAPHKQDCYKSTFINAQFPITEKISDEALSLPISPHHNESDIEYVCGVIKDFFNSV
jgi:dTDP-4-amino-4,6-dideoxygalactose transaminase